MQSINLHIFYKRKLKRLKTGFFSEYSKKTCYNTENRILNSINISMQACV